MNTQTRLEQTAALVYNTLDKLLQPAAVEPIIGEAMRYSALSKGKMVRPFLTLEFCRMLGGTDENAVHLAAAIELIHCYSLVHDDLPCMDDDDMRRGKPATHVKYGYAGAVLTGDALLTRAFGVAAEANLSPEQILSAVRLLAHEAGHEGMIGGQQIDTDDTPPPYSHQHLERISMYKTCALFRCAAQLGCIAAGREDTRFAAVEYADNLGLAFQIIDDILDYAESKDAGLPEEKNFAHILGEAVARNLAKTHTEVAIKAVVGFDRSEILVEFAKGLLTRVV